MRSRRLVTLGAALVIGGCTVATGDPWERAAAAEQYMGPDATSADLQLAANLYVSAAHRNDRWAQYRLAEAKERLAAFNDVLNGSAQARGTAVASTQLAQAVRGAPSAEERAAFARFDCAPGPGDRDNYQRIPGRHVE